MYLRTQPMEESNPEEDDEILQQIIEAVRNARSGQVQITVQESGSVRIEKTE